MRTSIHPILLGLLAELLRQVLARATSAPSRLLGLATHVSPLSTALRWSLIAGIALVTVFSVVQLPTERLVSEFSRAVENANPASKLGGSSGSTGYVPNGYSVPAELGSPPSQVTRPTGPTWLNGQP